MKNARLFLIGILGVAVLAIFLFKSTVDRSTGRFAPVVPSGTRQSSSVVQTDAEGAAWALDQAGGALISTEPNAPKAGPPIVVKTSVQKVAAREVSIGLLLEGQAGEQYRPTVRKDGSPRPAPGLRIVNEAGQVLEQGNFQYG